MTMPLNNTLIENPRAYKAPVEAVAGARTISLGAMSRAVMAATIVAMLLGGDAFSRWASELPVDPLSDLVITATEAWQHATEPLGLTRIAAGARQSIERVERWRW